MQPKRNDWPFLILVFFLLAVAHRRSLNGLKLRVPTVINEAAFRAKRENTAKNIFSAEESLWLRRLLKSNSTSPNQSFCNLW